MKKAIEILDTTLRDGSQAEGIAFSVQDKIQIFTILAQIGIPLIECGNPTSNEKDKEVFEELKSTDYPQNIVAFGSTRRKGISVQEDAGLKSLLESSASTLSIVGKSSLFQVENVLKTTAEDNLIMISDTVSYLKEKGKNILFDCEHFFDGYKQNPDYSMKTLRAAQENGADCLVLCDTNGGSMPFEVYEITKAIVKAFPNTKIGVHMHNDIGCAVANTLIAVRAGASHIQGTFNGFGERCGNANLSTIIPSLMYKLDCNILTKENAQKITATAKSIAKITETTIAPTAPYVGANAFTHKGGMHIDGMRKNSLAFEHIAPETVGNHRRLLLSEVAGKSTVLYKLQQFIKLNDKTDKQTEEMLEILKHKEAMGFQYENAEASFELLTKKTYGLIQPFFKIVLYRVMGEKNLGAEMNISSAIVKVTVGEKSEITAEEGNGPVNALDKALRKALSVFFPEIRQMRLTDYRVRVVNPGGATASMVRVLIEHTDHNRVFTTVGVSTDVIDASFQALVDAVEYKLAILK